jgi:hypothetical protein
MFEHAEKPSQQDWRPMSNGLGRSPVIVVVVVGIIIKITHVMCYGIAIYTFVNVRSTSQRSSATYLCPEKSRVAL